MRHCFTAPCASVLARYIAALDCPTGSYTLACYTDPEGGDWALANHRMHSERDWPYQATVAHLEYTMTPLDLAHLLIEDITVQVLADRGCPGDLL